MNFDGRSSFVPAAGWAARCRTMIGNVPFLWVFHLRYDSFKTHPRPAFLSVSGFFGFDMLWYIMLIGRGVQSFLRGLQRCEASPEDFGRDSKVTELQGETEKRWIMRIRSERRTRLKFCGLLTRAPKKRLREKEEERDQRCVCQQGAAALSISRAHSFKKLKGNTAHCLSLTPPERLFSMQP